MKVKVFGNRKISDTLIFKISIIPMSWILEKLLMKTRDLQAKLDPLNFKEIPILMLAIPIRVAI